MNGGSPTPGPNSIEAGGDLATTLPGGVEVTHANLEAEVLLRSRTLPVVTLVWSPRSETSVRLGADLADLAESADGKWSFATVNVAKDRRAAQMFGVQGVPKVVAVAGGEPVSNFSGPRPPDQLKEWIASVLAMTAATFPSDS